LGVAQDPLRLDMLSPDAKVDAVVARAPADCRLREKRTENPYIDARHAMEICNACRYCEGFCAVFPAMTRRREFGDSDLNYLANLCHNCRACFYSCPYVPPHEFGINVPQVFSEIRLRSYETYCFPAVLGSVFRSNGMIVAAATVLGIVMALILASMLIDPGAFGRPVVKPGDFYAIVPYRLMLTLGLATSLLSMVAMAVGAARFWTDAAGGRSVGRASLREGLFDALSLKNLGSPRNRGCNDRGERYTNIRRRFHHLMFYGFMLCFASTCAATAYDHFLGLQAPYALASIPVQLGLWGGIGMLIGTSGLIWLKITGDPQVASPAAAGSDYALLLVLAIIALTGLALLALRGSSVVGLLLVIHLGVVFAFFLMIPYSKMIHGLYRLLALVHSAAERRAGQTTTG
jgi:citrate/tricarballylate utilization protein